MPIIAVIYISMIAEENYTLQISSSTDDESHLGRLISYLFSNEYLYTHSSFRKLIESDRKGYIGLHLLLQNQCIRRYFDEIGLRNQRYEVIYLKTAIRTFCSELHYHDDRVRRVVPWNKKTIIRTKPFCIQHLDEKIGVSDVRSYFGEESFMTGEEKKRSIRVYSQNWREKMEGIDSQSLPFKVMDYAGLCKEQARWAKLWQISEFRFYRPLEPTFQCPTRAHHPDPMIFSSRQYAEMPHSRRTARQDPEQSAAFASLAQCCNPQHNELLLSSSFPHTQPHLLDD